MMRNLNISHTHSVTNFGSHTHTHTINTSEPEEEKENPERFGKLYNPSKRYQVTIGISGFGTRNAHIIPINEFNHEDWLCPRCHERMQDTILYKNKRISCQNCNLELWREEHWAIQAKE